MRIQALMVPEIGDTENVQYERGYRIDYKTCKTN